MRRLAIIFTALFLFLCGTAQAESFSPEVEGFYANAIVYWGHEPPQCKTITKEALQGPVSVSGQDSVIGEATEPSYEVGCFIKIDEARQPWEVCRVVMHEVGHLEGDGHSSEPTSIMYPVMQAEQYAPGCPAPEGSLGYSPEYLTALYNHWMKVHAKCKKLRHPELCYIVSRQYREEFEAEADRY